jgi:hypothetical protein
VGAVVGKADGGLVGTAVGARHTGHTLLTAHPVRRSTSVLQKFELAPPAA